MLLQGPPHRGTPHAHGPDQAHPAAGVHEAAAEVGEHQGPRAQLPRKRACGYGNPSASTNPLPGKPTCRLQVCMQIVLFFAHRTLPSRMYTRHCPWFDRLLHGPRKACLPGAALWRMSTAVALLHSLEKVCRKQSAPARTSHGRRAVLRDVRLLAHVRCEGALVRQQVRARAHACGKLYDMT